MTCPSVPDRGTNTSEEDIDTIMTPMETLGAGLFRRRLRVPALAPTRVPPAAPMLLPLILRATDTVTEVVVSAINQTENRPPASIRTVAGLPWTSRMM
jgi:hypothetical protein